MSTDALQWTLPIQELPQKTEKRLTKKCVQNICWIQFNSCWIPTCQKLSGGMLACLCVSIKMLICIWPSWCYCHSLTLAPVNPDGFYLPSFTFLVLVHPGTHTQIHNCFTAHWILSGTTRVSRYQKKHSTTHTYCGHKACLICFLHLLQSNDIVPIQSTCLIVLLHNLSAGFLWSTSWPGTFHFILIHFFIQLLSSFCNTCLYHHNLFCCGIEIMSSHPSLSINFLLGTLYVYVCVCVHKCQFIWTTSVFTFVFFAVFSLIPIQAWQMCLVVLDCILHCS